MKTYNIEDIRAAQNEAQALIAALELLAQDSSASVERIRTHRDGVYHAVQKALGIKKRGSFKTSSQMISASRLDFLREITKFVFNEPRQPVQTGEVVRATGSPLSNVQLALRQLDVAGILVYLTSEESVHANPNYVTEAEIVAAFDLKFEAPLLA